MLEEGKHQSSGVRSFVQEHKKQKAIASASMLDQGKGTSACNEAKSLVKHGKGIRVIFSSDAERNLDGARYRLGDMVWAKVKSHPWWPGQLYDPALASDATECKRDSCFLVAFFGDSTYNWFPEAELIPYEPNFPQKSRQTSLPSFVDAVEDSLDEVRRRVKSALTCHCSTSEEASKSGEKRFGLLYDRQSRDIRRSFEPAKLLSTIKQLACSPFSSSQNMLRSTVAGAQTNAFRLLVSSKGIEGLGVSLQSNHIKAHDPDAVRSAEVLKDKTVPERSATIKHQLKMSLIVNSCQEQADGIRKQSLKEKLGGTVDVGKAKQHTKGVISKKGSTEKSKDSRADKGVTKGTVSEKKSLQPVEYGVQDKQAMSASVGKEILARKQERGIQESGQSPEQSECYMTSGLSDKGIPCLVGSDSLTTSQNNAQQRKMKKSAGLAVKAISTVVPEAEAVELVVADKKPNAALKKAKVAKVDDNQFSKVKSTKKFVVADVESSQARKKVKVMTEKMDKVFKQPKRVPEDEPKEGLDVLSRETKKRKLLPECRGKDNSDLGDYTGDSIAFDVRTSDLSRQADDVISDPMGLESDLKYMCVESLMPVETEGILPTETPDMVLEVGQLHQEDVVQEKHADDDSNEAQDVGAGFLMQPKELDADHKSVGSPQTEITSSINKEKEVKVKDSNRIEHREVSTFQAGAVLDMSKKKEKTSEDMKTFELLKPEGLSHHDNDVNVQGEAESLGILSKVIEDQTSEDLTVSPTEADPSLAHFHGTSPGRSLACSAVENMQDVSQTSKEVPSLKCGREREPLKSIMKSKHLPPSNKVFSSKKRVVEECLSKSSKPKNKRMKTVSMENVVECHADFVAKDGEEHEILNKRNEEIISLQNLHEGLLSVAAKPLDADEEEFCSAVCRAFKNFRKVVYKKAVYHTGPENSATSSAAAASEEVSGVGIEIDKMAELVKEQAEVKVMSSDNPIEAELFKAKDAKIQEGVDVFINQKQSKEDSTTSSRPAKRSVGISKTPSSSSISLRPAFEVKIPARRSKEVLNRFGQRVPRLLDAGERITSPPSRLKSYSEERALIISFAHGFVLPSEKQLREVFATFGDLNAALTRVDSKSNCAHVVFRHTQDAEAALSSMKENPVFENARFWLKPRDADRKEMAKIDSRNTAFSDRPILSSGIKQEAKIASDKVRIKTASDRGLLVSSSNESGSIRVGDTIGVTQKLSSRVTEVGGKKGALQSNYGVKNAPSSLIVGASQKAPVGALGPGEGKLAEIHSSVVPSSSVFLNAGPRSLAPPVAIDISEPLVALLHQLHDLVVSTGFIM